MTETPTLSNFLVNSAVSSSSVIPRGTSELREEDGFVLRYLSNFSLGR